MPKKATDRTGVYRTVTSPLKQFRTVHECSFTQTNNHSLEEHSEDVLVRFAYTRTTPCHHLNPHDTELFLATPLTEFEKANSGDVQLTISLFLVGSAAVAFVHALNIFSPDSPGKKADGQSTLL
jgi:hypothetical protein